MEREGVGEGRGGGGKMRCEIRNLTYTFEVIKAILQSK